MKKLILTALLYTVVTAVLLGLVYPLAITALARVAFPAQSQGTLLHNGSGALIGSALLGQPFTGDRYFHTRPSAAGTGYDASASSGSNLGPTSKALDDRLAQSAAAEKGSDVPVDLITTSASGLDPDITPAAALFQVARVARARNLPEADVRGLVARHITPRQLLVLGEPRVNVLLLNLELDAQAPPRAQVRVPGA